MPFDADDGALRDIQRHIGLARRFVEGIDYGAFHDDIMRIYAVTRCLEIISEASRRLSDELKTRHKDIAWKQIAGAGNVYRHDYEDVAAQRVWDTVHIDLPNLLAIVMHELAGRSEPN